MKPDSHYVMKKATKQLMSGFDKTERNLWKKALISADLNFNSKESKGKFVMNYDAKVN